MKDAINTCSGQKNSYWRGPGADTKSNVAGIEDPGKRAEAETEEVGGDEERQISRGLEPWMSFRGKAKCNFATSEMFTLCIGKEVITTQ